MKRVKFSKEALLSLDAILREMGITLHEDSSTNDEFEDTIIGYDGKAISIEETLSLFNLLYSNEVRLIDANALHSKICEDVGNNYGASLNIAQVLLYIENAPTIKAEPVRYGRWTQIRNGEYYCSNCGREERFIFQKNYCPKCGSDMREVREDAES